MSRFPQIRMLPDGRRLHLQDGPIDLIIQAFGSPAAIADAYRIAALRLHGLLDILCDELPVLRSPSDPAMLPSGRVAQRMHHATTPYAAAMFITPMAAVAGAVADEILAGIRTGAALERVYVNNGGDIAFYCAPGQHLTAGMVDRPDRSHLFGRVVLSNANGIGGIATSGWRGRSFSLGIADSVTVLARNAASADAAATVIANAVDLPHHPAVHRAPAASIQCDSDLEHRLVTRGVDRLDRRDRAKALLSGIARAEDLMGRGLIVAAVLHLQGEMRIAGHLDRLSLGPPSRPFVHCQEAPAHA